MITKSAAAWMEHLQRISRYAQNKIHGTLSVPSRSRYVSGLSMAFNNLLRRTGYSRASVSGLTTDQYTVARQRIMMDWSAAKRDGNALLQRRQEDALRFLEQEYWKHRHVPRADKGLDGLETNINAKLVYSEGLNLGKDRCLAERVWGEPRFVAALGRYHEGLEAVYGEKGMAQFYRNPERVVRAAARGIPNEYEKLLLQADPKNDVYNPWNLVRLANKNSGFLTLYNRKNVHQVSEPSHADLSVLLEERRIFDRISNPTSRGARFFRKMREDTREYPLLDYLGEYDAKTALRNFGKENARKVLKSQEREGDFENWHFNRDS